MFNFFKKKDKRFEIKSPATGIAVALEETPDEAFSRKMLGDGITVVPENGDIVSPVGGRVSQVFDTLHAYGIKSDDGLEILVHIGINTVELKGEGFKALVREGQSVKVGDPIARVDINYLKEKGYSLHTPVIITNLDQVKDISYETGKTKAGETTILYYGKR